MACLQIQHRRRLVFIVTQTLAISGGQPLNALIKNGCAHPLNLVVQQDRANSSKTP
jgi:hypothetical protein